MLTKMREMMNVLTHTHTHGTSRNNLGLVSTPKNTNMKLVM